MEDVKITVIIAIHGVLNLFKTDVNIFGIAFLSPIPNNNLDPLNNITKAVLNVEKSAIIDKINILFSPRTYWTTNAKGPFDTDNSCQGTILTADIATKMYIIVVIDNE